MPSARSSFHPRLSPRRFNHGVSATAGGTQLR
jgi:hypothetical protein